MLVRVLFEYSTQDSEYRYIERWEKIYKQESNARNYWQISLIRSLLERSIVSNHLKLIELEYVGS